jgi:hypothetical protein
VSSLPPPSAAPFEQSNYCVKVRAGLWNPFVRRHSEYEIRSIPPMSSAHFSFSWDTGMVRREPDGPPLLAVAPPEAPGLFGSRAYVVTDAAARAPLGQLVPDGDGWRMVAPSGQPAGDVVRRDARPGFVRYQATLAGREVCRFTWTIAATVVSAELEIEFTPDADAALRMLAVALAPILELRARLFSERHTTH